MGFLCTETVLLKRGTQIVIITTRIACSHAIKGKQNLRGLFAWLIKQLQALVSPQDGTE